MPLEAMKNISEDEAVQSLKEYFEVQSNGRPLYTGSRFETLAGGGSAEPNRITSSDLIAVSMLAVHVPAQAGLGILGPMSEKIERLLYRIPVDAKLEELTQAEYNQLLGEGSPAEDLWFLLRQKSDRWKVGQTTASKILARKRPHLIPVYDSVVKKQTKLSGSGLQWQRWFDAFHSGEDGTLATDLRSIREKSSQHHLSLIRVLDIVLWMHGRRGAEVVETVGDDDSGS